MDDLGNLGRRYQDRIAVITAAGSGIGAATAQRLMAEGAVVLGLDLDDAVVDSMARLPACQRTLQARLPSSDRTMQVS